MMQDIAKTATYPSVKGCDMRDGFVKNYEANPKI